MPSGQDGQAWSGTKRQLQWSSQIILWEEHLPILLFYL